MPLTQKNRVDAAFGAWADFGTRHSRAITRWGIFTAIMFPWGAILIVGAVITWAITTWWARGGGGWISDHAAMAIIVVAFAGAVARWILFPPGRRRRRHRRR